jgi:SNF2 family DNA or RNA helicase
MPFQVEGAGWLAARRRALLADEMGLGKTCQAIIAADHVAARDVLVLAPAAVCVGWVREFAAWGRMHRPARIVRQPGDADGEGVRVVSYDKARDPPVLNALRSRRWDLLVCDEADYLKNPHAARTKAVLGPRCDETAGLVSCATYAWGLTGTPMPNSADELWAPLRAFGPRALGDPPMSYRTFRKRFCTEVPIGEGRSKIVGLRNKDELRSRMAPHVLRRRMDDVLPALPPMTHEEISLAPGAGAAELAAMLADDPELSALSTRLFALSLVLDDSALATETGQLLQTLSADSVSRLRQRTGAVKARVLGPVLAAEMSGSEDKVVVMVWHTEALDSLQDALAPFGAVRLDGQTKPAERQEAIDAFQSDPGTRVFLGQILAAGAGITLTAGAEIVFAELSWSPRDNAQAARRIRRIGQDRPTRARYPHLAGTIDEAVIRTLRRKTQDIKEIVGA